MHKTLKILKFYFKNNIILYCLLSYTSYKLQPCNVAAFSLLKAAYRDQVKQIEQGRVKIISKQHFIYLYSPAREKALIKRNILAAQRGSSLFLFNSNRVLADMLKLPSKLTILNANKSVESCLQYKLILTPTTLVSLETLASLLYIIKHIPNNKASSQRKERL